MDIIDIIVSTEDERLEDIPDDDSRSLVGDADVMKRLLSEDELLNSWFRIDSMKNLTIRSIFALDNYINPYKYTNCDYILSLVVTRSTVLNDDRIKIVFDYPVRIVDEAKNRSILPAGVDAIAIGIEVQPIHRLQCVSDIEYDLVCGTWSESVLGAQSNKYVSWHVRDLIIDGVPVSTPTTLTLSDSILTCIHSYLVSIVELKRSYALNYYISAYIWNSYSGLTGPLGDFYKHWQYRDVPLSSELADTGTIDPILKNISDVWKIKFIPNISTSSMLIKIGIFDLWMKHMTSNGADVKQLEKVINNYKLSREFNRYMSSIYRKLNSDKLELYSWKLAVQDLWPNKSKDILHDVQSLADLMGKLSKSEKEDAKRRIKIEQDLRAQIKNNKCNHLKAMRSIEQLRQFMGHTDAKGQVLCKICDLPIMCSHQRDYMLGDKTALAKYVNVVDNTSTCKLCGGLMEYMDADINIEDSGGTAIQDPLVGKMKAPILKVVSMIDTDMLMNKWNIVNLVSDAIFDSVSAAISKIDSTRSLCAAEMESKRMIVIMVHSFIYVAHFIIEMRKRYVSKSIAFKKETKDNKESSTLRFSYSQAVAWAGAKLTEKMFFKLYKMYSDNDTISIVSNEDYLLYFVDLPTCDFIYYYHMLERGDSSATESKDKTIKRLVPDLKWSKYKLAKLPSSKVKFSDIPKFSIDKCALAAKIYGEYVYAYVHDSYYRAVGVVLPHLVGSDDTVANNDKFIECEAELRKWRAAIWARPRLLFPSKPFTKDVDGSLAEIFGEDGHRHLWTDKETIYFYENGTSSSKSKINKNVASGGTGLGAQSRVVDVKCPICHVKLGSCGQLSIDKIRKSIMIRDLLKNIIIYYEHRCPAGGTHSYVDSVCTKCGYVSGGGFELNDANEAFFTKWKVTYDNDRSSGSDLFNSSLHSSSRVTEPFKNVEWNGLDHELIKKVVKNLKISEKTLVNLGSPKDGISSEAANEIKTNYMDVLVKLYLSHYNRVRFSARSIKPSELVRRILINAKWGIDNLSGLSKFLPDLSANYINEVELVRAQYGLQAAHDFSLMSLCRMIDELIGSVDQIKGSIGRDIFALIARTDRLWTRKVEDVVLDGKEDPNYVDKMVEARDDEMDDGYGDFDMDIDPNNEDDGDAYEIGRSDY